jgi:hypothetical protein
VIDLKHEIERELGLIDPPDLWERIRADADDDDFLAGPLPIDTGPRRRRHGLLAAVAAATVLLALIALEALPGTDPSVDSGPATEGPVTSAPSTAPPTAPPTTLAPEAAERFRVSDVVVAIQCRATKSTPDSAMRDVVLGGVVTDNPDDLATLDGVSVAVGDLLALIIREDPDGGRRITLYDNTQWFGGAPINSCDELVESVPTFVDGGFFHANFPGGYELLPGE